MCIHRAQFIVSTRSRNLSATVLHVVLRGSLWEIESENRKDVQIVTRRSSLGNTYDYNQPINFYQAGRWVNPTAGIRRSQSHSQAQKRSTVSIILESQEPSVGKKKKPVGYLSTDLGSFKIHGYRKEHNSETVSFSDRDPPEYIDNRRIKYPISGSEPFNKRNGISPLKRRKTPDIPNSQVYTKTTFPSDAILR